MGTPYIMLNKHSESSFSPPSDLSQPNLGVSKFDLNGYVKDSQLGAVVAANYFTVEVGTSTTSISATSAVESSTLASISTTATSGSAASSSTGSSSNAASVTTAGSLLSMLSLAAIALLM
ncbi:hypothetical protein EV361DRAFT_952573 [Lentinula raphanica]|nr:hypothetical protein EV361DRAFT_952573 [Lentinula raphanica]